MKRRSNNPIVAIYKVTLIILFLFCYQSIVTAQNKMMANCVGGVSASPASVCSGGTSSLSLTGVNCLGSCSSYQWQNNINAGGWNNIVGATSSTYTTPALTYPNSYQYRCTAADGIFCSSNTSTSVTLTPSENPTTSDAGSTQNICISTATLAGNTPAVGTGNWSLVSGSGSITSSTSPTSGLTSLGSGANTFRWTITNGSCTSTDDVIINFNDAVGGTASAGTICATSASLSLSGENGTIQWQENVNSGGWNDISGATTDPYSATLVYANSYDFRANLTTACGTSTSTTVAVAPVGVTNYTFSSPSISVSKTNGNCLADYTFTQSSTSDRGSAIALGVTATVNFVTGTDATTMTAGTFNGTAINMGTVTKSATQVTFTTPVAVSCASTSFTIVLNNITNPGWGTGCNNGSVSVPNITGGNDSYATYNYCIAELINGFYDDASAWTRTYATANTAGHCYNNLTAGKRYCFNYTYPSSGNIEVVFIQDQGTSGCGSSSISESVSPASSGCTSSANSDMDQYSNQCTWMYAGLKTGGGVGCSMTGGTIYTVCYDVPTGCTGINICPLVNCSAGSCGGGGLPIELLSFSAVMINSQIHLNWTTATEINNDYFTIERTKDGVNFEQIISVKGAGNSSSILTYYSIDDNPYTGTSYYRLKQTDFDGKYSYSKIVAVKFIDKSISQIEKISQGTESFQLNCIYLSAADEKISCEMFDSFGKKVFSKNENAVIGQNEIPLNIIDLSTGIYFLRISSATGVSCQRFTR